MAGVEVTTAWSAEQRLTQAYRQYGEELVRALAGLLGDADDARDVAQEAFLKCWRHRSRLGEVRDLKAWLFRIGLNAARDLRRNVWRQRARPLLLDTRSPGGDRAAQAALYHETLQRLDEALRRLRPEEREVFLLRHDGDLTYEQIARRINVPLGTVKTRMRAALSRLKYALDRPAA